MTEPHPRSGRVAAEFSVGDYVTATFRPEAVAR